MADINGRKKKLRGTWKKLKDHDALTQHNIDILADWKRKLHKDGLSTDRICRYLSSFNTLAQYIDFPLDDPSQEEIDELIGRINQGDIERQDGRDKAYSPRTLKEFKKAINRLYKFIEDDEDPEILDGMTIYVPESKKNRIDPERLINAEIVRKIRSSVPQSWKGSMMCWMPSSFRRFWLDSSL